MADTRIIEDQTPRPILFLDLDGTLFRMGKSTDPEGNFRELLSPSNLKFLKESGIRDILIFTNMDGGTLESEYSGNIETSRYQIVEYLKKEGFNVIGVSTPADIAYANSDEFNKNHSHLNNDERKQAKLGAVYQDFYLKQRERVETEKVPRLAGGGIYATEPEFFAATKRVNEFKSEAESPSNRSKLKEELGVTDADIPNVKAGMHDMALPNLPSWVSSIVVLDDEESPRKAIKTVHEKRNSPLPIVLLNAEGQKDPFVEKNTATNVAYLQKNLE